MKRSTHKLLTLLMAVIMIMAFSIFVNAETDTETETKPAVQYVELADDYTGRTVILSSNDVHGAVDGYAYMKALENELTARGADVITVDAGDFSQGTTYVSESKGGSAIDMMNLAGYDYSTLGNHEFDFGPDAMKANISNAQFKILCADLLNKADDTFVYAPSDIYEGKDSDLKIGFFGMATPETQTKAIPTNFINIEFPSKDEIYPMAQDVVDQLKADGADVIICLAHLGVDAESSPYRSTDLAAVTTGIDIIIDGHSHTVMTEGEKGEAIMSTGTKFMNIGVTVIDEETETIESAGLYHLRDADGDAYTEALTPDADVKAVSDELIAEIDAAYGAPIAESKVELNGEKKIVEGVYGNRDGETNLGDLITDAMKWYIMKDGTDLGVPDKNVVTITNGGGIRAWLHAGAISKKDITSVLPFGNTIAAVTVKGSELLEALEASTYCTPEAVGGFPQIEGMKISISTYEAYDANAETYLNSTYYGPASIKRVRIKSVNGKKFDPEATYVVLTNNFCADGGDTYFAFANASSQFDTGITADYAVQQYVIEQLDGVIDETYAEPQGRIKIYSSAGTEIDAIESAAENTTDAIAKLAADVVDAVTVGLSADKYTKDSFAAYTAAIEAATAVLNDADATKADYEAADAALVAAKNALVLKKAQTMTVKGKTVTLKSKALRKKARIITAKKAFKVSKKQGKVTYKKVSGNSKIKVAKNGKITVKKGLKKGTYKIKVKVTAAGNDNYLSGSKKVTVKIKVK